MRARLKQQRAQHWHHGERDQQGTRQGVDDGQCHRPEQLALQALEAQQWHEHHNDDDDARHHRHHHLATGFEDRAEAVDVDRLALRMVREPRLDVLHHHHRRVDQHADRDRQPAKAHQVGGEAGLLHGDEGSQRRQRQRHRHSHGGTQIAEEQH